MPSSWLSSSAPVKARSVPFSRMTWNCSGVSKSRHSASVLCTFCLSDILNSSGEPWLSRQCADAPYRSLDQTWLRSGDGDEVDLDERIFRQARDLDRSTRRRDDAFRRKVFRVNLVHCGEVAHA